MRRFFPSIAFAAALAASSLVSCSDSDKTPEPVGDKTFTGMNALEMTYCGAPMAGKTVAVHQDGANASMTLDSHFDLSTLSAALKGFPALQGPGVIPGSPVLQINTPLSNGDGRYEFAGKGETDFATYSYSGSFDASKMTFAFTDVRLKDQSFAGTGWAPRPAAKNPSGIGYSASPLHIVWETSMPIPIPGLESEIGDLLNMLAGLPLIPVYNGTAYMSLVQAVESALKTVGFNANGNMPVCYLQRADGAAQFANAPLCMIQYLPVAPGVMKLYVNPTDVLTLVLLNNTNRDPNIPEHPFGIRARETAAGSAQLQQIVTALVQKLAPVLSQGIPANYTRTDDSLELYIGSDVLVPLLKQTLLPLMQNPEVMALLMQKLAENPALSTHLPAVKAALTVLPAILENTTRIEFGLNLVPTK